MMTKKLSIIIAFFAMIYNVSAQDSTSTSNEKDNSCVRACFNGSLLIENQTTVSPLKGGIHFIIHHRFSKIEKIDDIFGIYGASNIRVGVDYGITDRIMVGFGTEKYNMMQELHWKFAILRQTVSNSMPFSLSYFGNVVLDARKKDIVSPDTNYKFAHRLSYFHQIIIARKFGERIGLEIAPSYSHFNLVEGTIDLIDSVTTNPVYQNDVIGLTVGGKVKLFGEVSLLFEYDQSFWLKTIMNYQKLAEPNYSLGLDIGTGTHNFQVFATTYDQIIPQKNFNYNKNELFYKDKFDKNKQKTGLRVGFNITVKF
jgi:hypothetical protein